MNSLPPEIQTAIWVIAGFVLKFLLDRAGIKLPFLNPPSPAPTPAQVQADAKAPIRDAIWSKVDQHLDAHVDAAADELAKRVLTPVPPKS